MSVIRARLWGDRRNPACAIVCGELYLSSHWLQMEKLVNETLAWRSFDSEGAVRTITRCTSCCTALNGLNRSSLSVRSLFTFVYLTLAKEEQKQFVKEPRMLVMYNVRFRLGSFLSRNLSLYKAYYETLCPEITDLITSVTEDRVKITQGHMSIDVYCCSKGWNNYDFFMFLKGVLLTAFIWLEIQ